MAQAKPKSSQQAAPKRRKASTTKTKSQNGSARSRSRGASAKAKSRKAQPKRTQPKAQSKQSQPKAQSKPAEIAGVVEEKAKVAEEKAVDAGKSVGRAVKKARVPLLAGGAVIAGAAGGAALASRQSHRHRGFANGIAHSVRKVDSNGVAKAARRVGDVSARVGQFAVDLQRARESSNGAGNGKHRSPIEVVLQGLTTRR